VPPMKIRRIQWSNAAYAARRVGQAEIAFVLLQPGTKFRRNLPGRSATHVAVGRTQYGRRVAVAFIYVAESRAAIPITAWESR